MADNKEVLKNIIRKPGVIYSVLTPNLKGFKDAVMRAFDTLLHIV